MSALDAGALEMSPRHALRQIENALPKDAIVSTDIGNICSVSNSYLRYTGFQWNRVIHTIA